MGFKDFLRGKDKEKGQGYEQEDDYRPPEGPPPSYTNSSHPQQTKTDSGGSVYREPAFAPPLEPPTSHRNNYAPPPGPPPSHKVEEYAPPAGPPPSYKGDDYAPPDGPPPSHKANEYTPPKGPPPYHNWQSIPGTSLLPPPPAFDQRTSSTSNATSHLADLAWHWTDRHPPFKPAIPHPDLLHSVNSGRVSLRPPEHVVRGEKLSSIEGVNYIKTTSISEDHTYLSSLPLYFENTDSPFRTETSKTIYYELKIDRLGRLRGQTDSSIAIGYCVAPYPTWRMPGWNRGSLAVHTDDGARFVAHDGGGIPFLDGSVKVGETIGLGLRFSIPEWRPDSAPVTAAGQPLMAEVFFTRNGKYFGGWNIQEDLDAEFAWRAEFLDGKWDMYAAVGTFGEAEVSVNFGAQKWLYNPTTFTGLSLRW